MTKEELEQLRFLKREAKQLKEQRNGLERGILQLKERDSVQASSRSHPYTKGSVHIEGIGPMHQGAYEALSKQLQETLQLLEENEQKRLREYSRLTGYIQSLPDSELRQILYWYLVQGLSWQGVATRIGRRDESYPRRKYKNFLENF